jgi:hypothetical protein
MDLHGISVMADSKRSAEAEASGNQETTAMYLHHRTFVLGAAAAGIAEPWVARAAEPECRLKSLPDGTTIQAMEFN